MLTTADEEHIERHAYLPEHVHEYVTAISGAEPFRFGDHLAYSGNGVLIFIGYPLGVPCEAARVERDLGEAVQRLKPGLVSLIGPAISPGLGGGGHPPTDQYYRLDAPAAVPTAKTRNMLKRAEGELTVTAGRAYGAEHRALVEAFLAARPVDEGTRSIFRGIDRYLPASETAWIFEARDRQGGLVAFDIAEFKPRDYAIYMFNFRSADRYVPGASDLLLSRVIRQAVADGKQYVNLGLGINPGVTAFKTKWGGAAFLPYADCQYRPPGKGLLETLLRWL